MIEELVKLRNIGISAHIDSGKTTLTERILFYTNRIHRIHEVKGKDGVGAKMDFMELERERGITITSASTNVTWKNHFINVIDTPGHVDFTIEVERSLRVLDGAILVLCGVGGVQSQSITVDRQMTRYKVPRIAFINKLDRVGANPEKVTQQLRDKLNHNAVMMQIPIGLEQNLQGVIDLVTMKAIYFEGEYGEDLRIEEVPSELREKALEKRDELVDRASMFSDALAEAYLEDRVTDDLIVDAVRKGTLTLDLTPVFIGSAFKNKGVQLLLDAIVAYLPSPMDVENYALDMDDHFGEIKLESDFNKELIFLAFKLEDARYGQLTYIRIYQGRLQKGDEIVNMRTGKHSKIGRLIRMHANEMADIESAGAGDIVALFGIECASGDTFTSGRHRYSMTSMFIPTPVISLMVKADDRKSGENMAKALGRFVREDPTFHVNVDPETQETIVRGMGELHLDIYIERMRREYGVALSVGQPQVAYRESISRAIQFNYTHKKQSGGAGQYARIAGVIEPYAEGAFLFNNLIKGGLIPNEFIPSCEKGFRHALQKGSLIGAPIVGVQVSIDDGNTHPVDSSDIAFQLAAQGAFRENYFKCGPVILEPIMRVSVEGPTEFQGAMIATLNQRRGIIVSVTEDGLFSRVDSEVPLAEMFGYSTVIRSATQGKAEFTMEFSRYHKVPETISEKLRKEFAEKKK